MNNFLCYIQKGDGSDKYFIPYSAFSIDEELNNSIAAEIYFNEQVMQQIVDVFGATIKQIFSGVYRELYITDPAGNVVYGGFLKNISYSRQPNQSGQFVVSSQGFFSLFEKRFTQMNSVRQYSQQDLSDIAWDLIDYTQTLSTTGADFGITRGADPTTRNADRTFTRQNIADAIRGLSNNNVNNGIDFDVSNSKVFNVYYPEKGSTRSNIILQDGFNIDEVEYKLPLVGDMANEVTAVGDGFSIEETPYVTVTSADEYKTAYYLLQHILAAKDVVQNDTLSNKAQSYLNEMQLPREFITCTCDYDSPVYGDYNVGDRIKLIIDKFNVNGFYRVFSRSLDDNRKVKLNFVSL